MGDIMRFITFIVALFMLKLSADNLYFFIENSDRVDLIFCFLFFGVALFGFITASRSDNS